MTLVLCLILLKMLISLILEYLNMHSESQNAGSLPYELVNQISPDEKIKSVEYMITKSKFNFIKIIYSSILTCVWLFWGFNFLNQYLTESFYLHATYLLISYLIISSILSLPLSLYNIFSIEERYGFNKMSVKLFFKDFFKELLVSLILIVPLFLIITTILDKTTYWWILAFGIITLFQIFVVILYPNFIAPLFNKFELVTGDIKSKLAQLLDKTGFNLKNLYKMDASKRSSKINAYFMGLFKSKRIVLFDTLTANLSDDEILAVIGHELGHSKKCHIWKKMVLQLLISFAVFYLLKILYTSDFYLIFTDIKNSSVMLLIFTSCIPLLTFYLNPIISKLSRNFEYEADAFASAITNSSSLQNALVKLTKFNKSNIYPHPLYVFFYYSHPPVIKRLEALQKL